MKVIKDLFYFLYQWLVFMPIFLVLTIITAIIVLIFAPIFGSKFWGYYPPKWWSRLTTWLALCRVKTSGHENLDKNQSYVFIANHQGSFDIFLTYGFLNQNIKWVQKASLRKIPLVGYASAKAGHVFVDNSSIKARARTIQEAKNEIKNGVSIMLFPEGARTLTGKMGKFKRGAYHIAHDLQLPIVPLTINGPYNVLKRGTWLIKPGKLELIIHQPIPTANLDVSELPTLLKQTRETIHQGLWDKYKDEEINS